MSVQVLTPDGPHHGKLVCQFCGAFIKWLPQPLPDGTFRPPVLGPALPLPSLKGSPKQIIWAETLREEMLRVAERVLERGIWRAMRSIEDATWWIGNRDRAPESYRWPREWYRREEAAVPVEKPKFSISDISELKGKKHWRRGTSLTVRGVLYTIADVVLVRLEDGTLRIIFFDAQGKAFYEGKEIATRDTSRTD